MKEFMKACFDANPMTRPTVEEVLSQLEKMVSASSVIEDEVYGTRKVLKYSFCLCIIE